MQRVCLAVNAGKAEIGRVGTDGQRSQARGIRVGGGGRQAQNKDRQRGFHGRGIHDFGSSGRVSGEVTLVVCHCGTGRTSPLSVGVGSERIDSMAALGGHKRWLAGTA